MLRPVSHPDLSKGVCPTRSPIIGYIRHHHPSQGVYRPPLARSIHGSGLFCARFQPILGTQKCFPRDFRDQFSIFPKISWIRGLFFKIVSRILGGVRGRFCPVAGGGGVLCLPSCGRSRCPVLPAVWACARCPCRSLQAKTGGRWPGLDHYRPGPASDLARPPPGHFWPCLAIVIRDFWPCLPCGPSEPLFCPVAGFLASGGLSYLPGGFRGPWGLYGGPVGPWLVGLGLPAGVRCLFGADGVPGLFLRPVFCRCLPGLCPAWPVWACFGPSGASSRLVWCPVVVWCFSSSTGQKKNGPVWVVSLWVCGCLS